MRGRPLMVVVALALLMAVAGVVAVRRADAGPVVRTVAVGPSPSAVVVDARAGHAFVLASDDTVRMLDAGTGQALRTIPVGKAATALALDERAGRVYVVNSNMGAGPRGSVSVIDAASGAVVATTVAGNVPYAVAVDEQAGHVFVLGASITGSVIMLDAVSGRALKAIDAGANGGPLLGARVLAVDARAGRGFALVSNDMSGARLSMFDTRRGVPLGPIAIGSRPFAVALDTRDGRAFVSGDSGIAVVNTRNGHVSTTRMPYVMSVAVDAPRRRVYAVAGGRVYVLDALTGRLVKRIGLAGMTLGGVEAVSAQSGRVFVAGPSPACAISTPVPCTILGDGGVYVVDTRVGVVRRVAVAVAPVAAAIDERTGRLFVVDGGGPVRAADNWAWAPSWLRGKLPFLPPPGPRTRSVPGSVIVVDLSRL